MRLDDPRLASLAGATRGLSAVVSFVEESADHRLFIAAALLEDGELRHVHRKVHLPTYGMFDERRFFAPGDMIRAVPSRLGVGLGLAICEDFWHLSTPQLLALDGAQILINVSSSPGRDLARTQRGGPRDRGLVAWADAHLCAADDVVRGVLQPRRRGREPLVLGRLRGHRAHGRAGLRRADVRRGPVHRGRGPGRRAARADLAAAAARRAPGAGGAGVRPPDRASGPGWPSTRPPRQVRRPGSTWRWTGERGRGGRRGRRCSRCPRSSRSTPMSPAGSSPRSSGASSGRPGSRRRCWGCRAGSTPRWSPTWSPRRSGPSGSCA